MKPECIGPLPSGSSGDRRETLGWDFILPASFDPLQVLPPELHHWAEEACFVVNAVLRKQVNRDTDAEGYARLHSTVLKEVLSWRALAPVLKALIAGGALERDSYLVGVRSYGYRLTRRYLGDRHVRRRPVNPILVEKLAAIEQRFLKEQQDRRKPIHEELNRLQQEYLTIVLPEAEEIFRQLPPETQLCQGVLLTFASPTILRTEMPVGS